MADLYDVENALKSAIVAAVYPGGIGNPSAIVDAVGNAIDCKVLRGWPLKDTLAADLANGIVNVSVFPQPGSERNTTRFTKDWRVLTPAAPTLTLTAAGNTVTVGGSVTVPQSVVIILGGALSLYSVQAGDTLTSIATALASLIAGATNAGPVITLPGSVGLITSVGGTGVIWREVRRQERLIDIGLWCPSPEARDVVAKFVDAIFAAVEFIALPDGTAGRILYNRSTVSDHETTESLYRRDLIYSVDYPTIQTQTAYQIAAYTVDLIGGQSPFDPALPTVVLNI